jgi:hypothetical protein
VVLRRLTSRLSGPACTRGGQVNAPAPAAQRRAVSSHMTHRRYAIACLLALFAFVSESQACTAPKPGYGLNMDDLIGQARTIVLVRLRSSSKVFEHTWWIKYTLETVEVIKGRPNRCTNSYPLAPNIQITISHSTPPRSSGIGAQTRRQSDAPSGRAAFAVRTILSAKIASTFTFPTSLAQ